LIACFLGLFVLLLGWTAGGLPCLDVGLLVFFCVFLCVGLLGLIGCLPPWLLLWSLVALVG
jgi:hypothetical protein